MTISLICLVNSYLSFFLKNSSEPTAELKRLLFFLRLICDVKISRGNRQGIDTIEVTIGDYPDDWQIAERWERVHKEMERLRGEGYKITETKREGNRFKSYTVESISSTL